MKLKQLTAIVITVASMMGAQAYAQDLSQMSYKERMETLKNMTPEQREEFAKARKEKWQSLSDAEKVKLIEQRRSEFLKQREEEWNSLSDAEKIERAEKMHEKMRGKHGKGESCHRGKGDGEKGFGGHHGKGDGDKAPMKEAE